MLDNLIAIDGRLLAYRQGGIARYVYSLATALVELWSRQRPGLPIPFRLFVNREVPHLPAPAVRVFTPPHHPYERILLGMELSFRSFRMLHSTDFVLPWLPPRMRRIVTIHDLAFVDCPQELAPAAYSYYLQTLTSVDEADRVVTPSWATAQRLIDIAPKIEERIRVIPLGVAEFWFLHNSNPEIVLKSLLGDCLPFLRGSRPLILAVGTVEPRKRYDLLLDAFMLLQKRLKEQPYLVVVGQEGWQSELTVQRLRQLEAKGMGRWLSQASDEVLRALYSVASVLVVTSRDEGFCLPVVEAMAAGLPVVAFAVGAIPEVAGKAALLLKDQTVEALVEGLRSLLQDTALQRELREKGPAQARHFSWEITAEKTLEVYRELMVR